jgi:hypothetical protein
MSNKIYVEVSIKRHGASNWKKIFISVDDRSLIDEEHRKISMKNPMCYVNFTWDQGESFLLGMPYQKEKEEKNLTLGGYESFMKKWYMYEKS